MPGKFSVIIPTMWKYEPFTAFLEQLVQVPIIDEIIIINNDYENTPAKDSDLIFLHPKIKSYDFGLGENIFVNPAFNYGVGLAKNDNICLLGDDSAFDVKVFTEARIWLEGSRDPVVVTVSSKPPESDEIITGACKTVWVKDDVETYHAGAVMFVRKRHWIDIPAGLNLFYGDNWIWETTLARSGAIFAIKDVFFYSPTSVTSKLFYTPQLLWREGTIFNACINSFREKIANAKN